MAHNTYAAAVAGAFVGGFAVMALMNLPPQHKPAEATQAVTAPSYTPPPETCDGPTCLETRSVIGNSARDVDPASFASSPDEASPPAASDAPAPAPSYVPVPVPVPVASAPDGVIERDVPIVAPQTATSTFVFSERERIGRELRREADRPFALERRAMRQERVERPVERRVERPIERRAAARAR